MKTTTKIAGAAVLASAVTAVGLFASDAVFHDATPARRDVAARPPAVADTVHRDRSAAPSALADLDVSREEAQLVREVVVKERARRESARIRAEDSGLDVLRRVIDSGADPAPVLGDWKTFRSHIRQREVAPLRVSSDAEEIDLMDVAGDSEVIDFGPGTFRINVRAWQRMRESGTHLEIRGAGRDRTTRMADGTLLFVGQQHRIENLVIRDLTLDVAKRGPVLSARGEVAVAFENVRFRSWSTGGYAAPIGMTGGVYLGCRNVEFDGESVAGGGGAGVALRGPCIALFQECAFVRMDSAFRGATEHSALQFIDCTFDRTKLVRPNFLNAHGRPELPVRVRGGTVRFGAARLDDEQRRKQWGAEGATEITGTVFEPAPSECTLEMLLAVLRLAEAKGPPVVGIEYQGRRDGVPAFKYFVPGAAAVEQKYVRYVGQKLEDAEPDLSGAPGLLSGEVLEGVLPLTDLIVRSGMPLTTEVHRLWYGYSLSSQREKDAPPPIAVHVGEGWPPPFLIDARSGAILERG